MTDTVEASEAVDAPPEAVDAPPEAVEAPNAVEAPEAVEAPDTEARDKDKTHRFLVVPVAKTEPGAGFTTGLRGRYVYRRPDDLLNRVTLDLVSRVSVRLVQQHEVRLRMRDMGGWDEVIGVNFRFDDDPVFSHSGVANHDRLTNAQLNEPRYEADRLSIAPDLNAQFVLARLHEGRWVGHNNGFLRGFGGWNFAYDRLEAEPDSLLFVERPQDLGGHTRGTYYAGVTFDYRNNDWNPKSGGFYDTSVGLGGPWAGGDTRWGRYNLSLRQYRSLGTDRIVLASEILAELQWGDVPLIPMGEFSGVVFRDGIGGIDTGRGYFRRRFVGTRKLFASTELRIEPVGFHLGRISVVLGIKPFVDLGWASVASEPIWADLHGSGGAGVFVVWDEFEVIRADLGISPEGVVVVMAADHAF